MSKIQIDNIEQANLGKSPISTPRKQELVGTKKLYINFFSIPVFLHDISGSIAVVSV